MVIALALALALQAGPVGPTPVPEPDDIVVMAASKGGCRVQFADKILSDSEFRDRARVWAGGVPVRVVARTTASFDCLKKIAFQLSDWGVKQIQFVDPRGEGSGVGFPQPTLSPPRPQRQGGESSAQRGAATDMNFPVAGPENSQSVSEIERKLLASHAAQLILDGKCAEARRVTLENGDLEAAAQVAQICRPN